MTYEMEPSLPKPEKNVRGDKYGYGASKWARFDTPEEAISAYTIRDGECLAWQGPYSDKAHHVPAFRYGAYGLGWRSVRTWLDPYRRSRLSAICGRADCVEPAHYTPVHGKYVKDGQAQIVKAEDRKALKADWKRREEIFKELKGYTLVKLGKKYGVSRERIRQILLDEELQPAREMRIDDPDYRAKQEAAK